MLAMAPLKEKLRTERRRAGLTQDELAKKASVGVATIARIEGARWRNRAYRRSASWRGRWG